MPNCDMCGSMKSLVPAFIEGTTLQVCADCAKHGKILPKPVLPSEQPAATQRARQRADAAMDEVLVDDLARRIKEARERQNLEQKDLAKRVKEKASVIHKIESGHMKPPLALARTLEKVLHITLVQAYTPPGKLTSSSGSSLTIGDLVKVRK